MATTNWVNGAAVPLGMDNAAPVNGAISKGTLTKDSLSVDYGIELTFAQLPGTATGPVSVYVALSGTTDVTALNTANAVPIGSHTPQGLTAEKTTRFAVGKAFSGQLPALIDVWVLNSTGHNMASLVVNAIPGYYETTA